MGSVGWRGPEERIRVVPAFSIKGSEITSLDPDSTFQNLNYFFPVSANYPCNQGAFPHACFIILAGWALTCLCHFGFRNCKPLTPDSFHKDWQEHVACAEHSHLLAYCAAWCRHTTARRAIYMYFTVLSLICLWTNSCFFFLKGPDTYHQHSSSTVLKG